MGCGGGGDTISEPFYAHDFIELRVKTKARIYEKCAPLYKKGLSLRDIEAETGIPKSSISDALRKHKLPLRNPSNGKDKKIDNKKTKRGGTTPYGWAYLDGQLMMDPKEQLVIRKIMSFHQSGKSSQAIADELNYQKIPTRRNGIWRKCVVLSIIRRQKENK